MITELPNVAVVIAAWNAEATIGRAVTSALIQPEVREIIVIDDRSNDETVSAAHAADDGSGRVRIIRLDQNSGPSAARNVGIAASSAPFIALLDADDFFLAGRFKTMFALSGWDACADNIAFINEEALLRFKPDDIQRFQAAPQQLTLVDFIERNISKRGRQRRELGFAKPVMRREFLAAAGLRYDETLRLGEDYALYTTMILKGAKFLLIRKCGYVAVERTGSLSGQHQTSDLAALLQFDQSLEANTEALDTYEVDVIKRHRGQLASKVRHRRFLDVKREKGLLAATVFAVSELSTLPGLAKALAHDKLFRRKGNSQEIGYLF